jgi:hypothetical protein
MERKSALGPRWTRRTWYGEPYFGVFPPFLGASRPFRRVLANKERQTATSSSSGTENRPVGADLPELGTPRCRFLFVAARF